MPRIIVATNPADDTVTSYLDAWHSEVVKLATKQNDTFIFDLNGKETNREELTKLIEEKNPQLVIINGHGSSDSVYGFGGRVLIKSGKNDNILINKIVHSLTCSSGKILGPNCIKIGAVSYIGYKEDFEIVHLKDKVTKEEKFNDTIARMFLEPAFEAIFSLIKGSSTQEAYKNSQTMFLKNLQLAITKDNPGLNTAVAPRLYHNFIHQVCLGDNNASF